MFTEHVTVGQNMVLTCTITVEWSVQVRGVHCVQEHVTVGQNMVLTCPITVEWNVQVHDGILSVHRTHDIVYIKRDTGIEPGPGLHHYCGEECTEVHGLHFVHSTCDSK